MVSRHEQISDCASTLQALQACQVLEPGASDSPGHAERLWRWVGLGVVAEFVRVLQAYPGLDYIRLTWNKVDQEYMVAFHSRGMGALGQGGPEEMEFYRDLERVKTALNTGLSVVFSAETNLQEPFLLALFERLASAFAVDPEALLPMVHRVAGAENLAVMRQWLLEESLTPQSPPSGPKVRM